jgi:hypothetical protein
MGSTHFEFFRILHFLQMYFAYNFFSEHFWNPLKKWSQHQILHFLIPHHEMLEIFSWIKLVLFQNLNAYAQKMVNFQNVHNWVSFELNIDSDPHFTEALEAKNLSREGP